MTTRRLLTMMAVLVIGVFAYASVTTLRAASPGPSPSNVAANGQAEAESSASPSPSASTPPPVYDITHLVRPDRKYLGVAMLDVPQNLGHLQAYTAAVGTPPNVVTIYESFDDAFAANEVRTIYSQGALAIIRWEPTTKRLADIAAGVHDKYILDFATAVRRLNLPIALTVAHEMNGDWYPWGTKGNTPADFVAAWRHIHDVFAKAGATNVIWIWNPNDIYPVPDVKLQPLYPGDAYVDWIGVTGYWGVIGPQTYGTLFLPTLLDIRKFTQKPFIIAETSVEPGTNQVTSVKALFSAVKTHDDILGFVWYDYNRQGDWRLENRPDVQAAYKSGASNSLFGFDVSAAR